jgi:hypothetical protein
MLFNHLITRLALAQPTLSDLTYAEHPSSETSISTEWFYNVEQPTINYQIIPNLLFSQK